MVFELLHKDLYQTIINNDLEMQLTAVRPIAKQVRVIGNETPFLLY